MAVQIDFDRDMCVLDLKGKVVELPIHQVVISTDPALHGPVIRCVDGNAPISEGQAQMLISAGAQDNR
ncbi:DUF3203 family protein [Metapseudomonas resinovorans]|uniref:Uncharacterized protein n=1 Tax=Metapseudomonas resinovorans NBRC 106553 TaxID=1245471 RepID=S6AWH4_METRE|nr:DUF3203 family protein [Pseudomonas resinovorans]BAN50708.1 hypothetical protein PCA10_49760 [Pseudomonas resinovorans NBRC 106553]